MANCFKTAEYCDQSEDPELAETVNDPFVNGVKKNNLAFRAMVLKTLGRVGSGFFLNFEPSIIKTPLKNKQYFR